MKERSKAYPMIYHKTVLEKVTKVYPRGRGETKPLIVGGGKPRAETITPIPVTHLMKFSKKCDIRGIDN